LKTARGGYDGKGQSLLKSNEDLEEAKLLLEHGPCVLEKWIPFVKEISVIITKGSNEDLVTFPVAENIHSRHILHQTIVPARISPFVEDTAIRYAKMLVQSLSLVGTLAVEMFLTAEDEIYINELAPRPHNSGHFTIEACETSQFEQHIRAIAGWPLASPKLLKPAVMVNILGQHQERLIKKIPSLKDWKIHLYGKDEAKTNRKMGHVTLLRESIEEALAEIQNSEIWLEENLNVANNLEAHV
jgi:5-(carboxyamino)imidazole ribonucleotide synthase